MQARIIEKQFYFSNLLARFYPFLVSVEDDLPGVGVFQPGVKVIKLFSLIADDEAKYVRVFVPGYLLLV